MKKYLTPSIEINKFDVEDIITASNEFKDVSNLSTKGTSLYTESGVASSEAANAVAEFNW